MGSRASDAGCRTRRRRITLGCGKAFDLSSGNEMQETRDAITSEHAQDSHGLATQSSGRGRRRVSDAQASMAPSFRCLKTFWFYFAWRWIAKMPGTIGIYFNTIGKPAATKTAESTDRATAWFTSPATSRKRRPSALSGTIPSPISLDTRTILPGALARAEVRSLIAWARSLSASIRFE